MYKFIVLVSFLKCYYYSILIFFNLNLRFKVNVGKLIVFLIYFFINLYNGLFIIGFIGIEFV